MRNSTKLSLTPLLLLTLLTMGVRATVYGQYPTTKTLNGVKVVIMTLPQAEQIDRKFITMGDSLEFLRARIRTEAAQKIELEAQIRELNSRLAAGEQRLTPPAPKPQESTPTPPQPLDTSGLGRRLLLAQYEIESLNREMTRIKKLEYADRRTRVYTHTVFGVGVLLWAYSLFQFIR